MPANGGWDVHSHLIPKTVIGLAQEGRYDMAVNDGRLATPMLRIPLGRIDSPDELTRWVDDQGLTGAIVSPPPPLFRPDLSSNERRKWTSLLNESLLEECASPKLRPLAYLPAEDPQLATEVIGDLTDEWVGVTVGTDLAGLVYSDPRFGSMWRALEEREFPVFIHPGACQDPRLEPFYLTNTLGNPYETTVAAAHLVFGDVIGRHPALIPILAHGGGATAALVGRWQRGADTGRPGIGKLSLTPMEAVTRFKVDTVVHSPSYLRQLIQVFGLEGVLFGSDWPFPMGVDDRDASLGGLDDSEKGAVVLSNPTKAYSRLT
jgi:aminocarboxymuconate-semialdehyde decarboxylase